MAAKRPGKVIGLDSTAIGRTLTEARTSAIDTTVDILDAFAETFGEIERDGFDQIKLNAERSAALAKTTAENAIDTIKNVFDPDPDLPPAESFAERCSTTAAAGARTSALSAQDILVANMEMFALHHQAVNYKNVTRLLTDDPGSILNALTQKKGIKSFFEIKPHEVAALVPKIRLYLVHRVEGQVTKKIPLIFNDHTGIDSIKKITQSRFGRGDGVGIKSFAVETLGTNPAEGAIVRCTLNIFFQNIEMLARQSTGKQPTGNDYIELILRRTTGPRTNSAGKVIPNNRILHRDGFQIMAVVGWATPPPKANLSPELRAVIAQSTQTIYLSLTDHTIDFRQDGTGILTAEYRGALEKVLSDDTYDVFTLADDDDNNVKVAKIEKAIDAFSKKGENLRKNPRKDNLLSELEHRLSDLKRRKSELHKKSRVQRYSQILTELYTSSPPRIGSVDLSPYAYNALQNGLPVDPRTIVVTKNNLRVGVDAKQALAARADARKMAGAKGRIIKDEDLSKDGSRMGPGDTLVKYFNDLINPKSPKNTRLSFLYFGDIVEVVSQVIEKNRKKDKHSSPDVRILLGPVTYNILRMNGTVQEALVNLADVPVSLKSFEFWFNKNVTKRKVNSWPLRSFLKSAASELVLNALGEHSAGDKAIKRNTGVGIHTFMARPTRRGRHPIKNSRVEWPVKKLNLIDGEKDNIGDAKHYILLYGTTEAPQRITPTTPKQIAKDIDEGIYHFTVGSDRGILKTVNFQKTDIPGLREARFTTQDAEEGQLRDKYNATLELIGSSFLFRPGQKVYINPTLTGLGSMNSKKSTARMLGLGGYYDVITVSSTFDRDRGYTTTLNCVWSSYGEIRPGRGGGGRGGIGGTGVGSGVMTDAELMAFLEDPLYMPAGGSPDEAHGAMSAPRGGPVDDIARLDLQQLKDKMARQDEMIAQMVIRQKEMEEEQKGREEGEGMPGAGDIDEDDSFEIQFREEILTEVNMEHHIAAWQRGKYGATWTDERHQEMTELKAGTKVLKALRDTEGNTHYAIWPAKDRNKSIRPHHFGWYSEYDKDIDTSPEHHDPTPVEGKKGGE